MQLFNTLVLASGLAGMVSAAAFGPPGGFKFPTPIKPTSTTSKIYVPSSSYSSTPVGPTSTSTPYGCAASTVTKNSTVTLPAVTVTQNASTLLVTVTATPTAVCLTSEQANYLIDGFASLLTGYTTANAELYLSQDFSDYSDSINFLIGSNLGDATFPTLGAFEAGQGTEPAIGFQVDQVAPITIGCTSVAFRWTATLGTVPAKGINLFQAVYTGDGSQDADWQILTNFSEFDVGAWELDIGNSCGPYTPSSLPPIAS